MMATMDNASPLRTPTAEEAYHLVILAEAALSIQDLDELADIFLKTLARLTDARAAFLYLGDQGFSLQPFYHVGLAPEAARLAEKVCAEQFCRLPAREDPLFGPLSITLDSLPQLALYPLERKQTPFGLMGVAQGEARLAAHEATLRRMLALLGHTLNNLLDRVDYERQIKSLNAYLSVSTMIAQALDLRDVLEAVLYFCMDEVAAEAASVLLLDYTKDNFRFYSAEGPAKPVLLTASFPANQGLAGAVLETQHAEVINDVQSDPRFYGKFDADSGFTTRNMIAIPLTAGAEKIGVLEVINKIDGPFTDDDLLFLQTIAQEIAFAIRNARLFEVVVKSYCKQRQGLNTCKGCKRPLGSWTPCVKYREEAAVLEV